MGGVLLSLGWGLPNHYGRFERCPRQSLLSLFRGRIHRHDTAEHGIEEG